MHQNAALCGNELTLYPRTQLKAFADSKISAAQKLKAFADSKISVAQKLKAFADSKISAAQKLKFIWEGLKIFLKRRKCRLPVFSPFSQNTFLTVSQTTPCLYVSAVQVF